MRSPSTVSRRIKGPAVLAAAALLAGLTTLPAATPMPQPPLQGDAFDGATAWLNCSGPIKLKELRGKVVLLDFWTYCCINCHHVLPDLAKLEEKYRNELVVLGVHTPKFYAEQDTENIRRKVREYRIKHPVISDANMTIWNRFGVNSWPTLVLIDPEGNILGGLSGEGHFEILDRVIGQTIEKAKKNKTLDTARVIKFFPENEKPDNTPLLFPGKVLADGPGNRLFVSDTGHNRIVQTDLEGKAPVVIGGGGTGLTDGPYDKAEFNRPQGMCLIGDTLYVADTENHAIRAVDLKAKTVSTVAGTGQQGQRDPRRWIVAPANNTALNSPWDLVQVPETRALYVAMAGPHQIWRLDLDSGKIGNFAGTGAENITDGPVAEANFAQPSGLATDGHELFVADSEVSAVRAISLGKGRHHVRSVVGQGLFEFGDVDGRGPDVRLQHCLGLAYADGKLYIADTYNNKIKVCDPKTREVKSFAGTGKPGDKDAPAQFYQPGGLSVAGSKLYVADTNNARIRVIDLESRNVSTLPLESLSPPTPPARRPVFVNAKKLPHKPVKVAPGKEVVLDVSLPIESGFHLNDASPLPYVVDSPDKELIAYSEKLPATGTRVDPPTAHFMVNVPLAKAAKAGEKAELTLSVQAFVCSDGSNLCTIRSYIWSIPVEFADDGPEKATIGE